GGRAREAVAREHVVEPPSDVALSHVAPRRPPREELIVVRIERPPDVDQPSLGEDPLEELPLLRPLAYDVRLALLGVDVAVGARNVHVTAEHERRARLAPLRGVADERL